MPDLIESRSGDVIVVGGGVGGMRAALALSPLRVVLLTKTPFGVGGASPHAQGGMAAAVAPGDSPAKHYADTLRVGAQLNDEATVDAMTEQAPSEVDRLVEIGTRFDRLPGGGFALGREGGHRRRRILHAGGDATGRELVRSLAAAVVQAPGIEIWDQTFARDLIVEDGRVVGVEADYGGGAAIEFLAPAILLATGGGGQLYRYTTNPPELTCDGMAMAARAGAALVDLEFVQFHPTAFAIQRDPLPLLTEALRGEGVPVLDEAGRRFLADVHTDAEMAPRDVVARAIFQHRQAGHEAFLDPRDVAGLDLAAGFPTVIENCREHGLDPKERPLPITPAAHYFMGGVETDLRGRTSVPGLWACGEVSATGAHGANRLASNSLLEAVVFGSRAAVDIRDSARPRPSVESGRWHHGSWCCSPSPQRGRLRDLMWRHAGLSRCEGGLEEARVELSRMEDCVDFGDPELANLLIIGRHLVAAALTRRESRGSHFRSDYPEPRASFERHLRTRVADLEMPARVGEGGVG